MSTNRERVQDFLEGTTPHPAWRPSRKPPRRTAPHPPETR
jgi:hypothetical protein